MPNIPSLTKEQVEEAHALEEKGMSRTAVALKYYVDEKTLQRLYKKHNLSFNRGRKEKPKEK